jgi:hypothetical protein
MVRDNCCGDGGGGDVFCRDGGVFRRDDDEVRSFFFLIRLRLALNCLILDDSVSESGSTGLNPTLEAFVPDGEDGGVLKCSLFWLVDDGKDDDFFICDDTGGVLRCSLFWLVDDGKDDDFLILDDTGEDGAVLKYSLSLPLFWLMGDEKDDDFSIFFNSSTSGKLLELVDNGGVFNGVGSNLPLPFISIEGDVLMEVLAGLTKLLLAPLSATKAELTGAALLDGSPLLPLSETSLLPRRAAAEVAVEAAFILFATLATAILGFAAPPFDGVGALPTLPLVIALVREAPASLLVVLKSISFPLLTKLPVDFRRGFGLKLGVLKLNDRGKLIEFKVLLPNCDIRFVPCLTKAILEAPIDDIAEGLTLVFGILLNILAAALTAICDA